MVRTARTQPRPAGAAAGWLGSDRCEAAIDSFYAAASREIPWSHALDALLEATAFQAATFYVHDRRAVRFDPARPVVRHGLWHRLDAEAEGDYRQHYFRLDPRVAFTLAHPGTRLLFDAMYTSPEGMRGGEYRDWYRRATGMAHSLGGHAGREQPFFGAVALHRPERAGPATGPDQARFSLLFGHLERALGIEYRLYESGKVSILHSLTDDTPNGIVLFGPGGELLHANRAARAMAAGGAFRLDRRLVPWRPDDRARLDGALLFAASGRGGQSVQLPRPHGGREYTVLVSPAMAAGTSRLFGSRVSSFAIIIDDDGGGGQRPAVPTATLQSTFDLSQAEARLLFRLLNGDRIADIARATRVTPATLRTQLASLFRKTGTSRQAELVGLAHRLAAAPFPDS